MLLEELLAQHGCGDWRPERDDYAITESKSALENSGMGRLGRLAMSNPEDAGNYASGGHRPTTNLPL